MTLLKILKQLTAVMAVAFAAGSFAADVELNTDANDLAIHGYDAVSYFSKGGPVKGKSKYSASYKEAIYHFSSSANRDAFKANPAKYAPQFGGYCAMGVALNKKLDVDPLAWHIEDGKLYLNLNKQVQKKWFEDVPGNIDTAERNWFGIHRLTVAELDDE